MNQPVRPRRPILALDQPWFIEALLSLVLFKMSGIRSWPHGYAGQAAEVPRLVYYGEFGVSLLALAALVFNLRRLDWHRPWVWLAVGFMAIATASALTIGRPVAGTVFAVLGYWDGFAVATLACALLDPQRLHRALGRAALVFIGLNVLAVGVPSRSFMIGEFAGKFRGLLAHRNDLAQVTTVAAFTLLCLKDAVGPRVRALALLAALGLIGLAGSVQGILLMMGGVAVFVLIQHASRFRHPMVAVSAVFVLGLGLVAWWSFGSLDEFLRLFGRDATFTGRDRIWRLALYQMAHMPWYGYGYGTFSSQIISPALLSSFELGTLFGTAHDSYLEALLAYGWVGGSVFLLTVLAGSWTVCRSLRLRVAPFSILAAMILFTCLIGGVTASEKLFMPQFGWLSFVLACALAQAATREPA